MTIDTQYLDSDEDKIKVARPALLAAVQRCNDLESSDAAKGSTLIGFSASQTQAGTLGAAVMNRGVAIKDPPFLAVGDGTTDDSPALQGACNVRASTGAIAVYCNVPKLRLDSDVDCKGAKLICSGTVFSGNGRLHNNAGIEGGIINGINQDEIIRAPACVTQSAVSRKVLYKSGANNVWVITKKARNAGYIAGRVIWNSFQTPESVGSACEFWRCIKTKNVNLAYTYKKAADVLSGTWADVNITLSPGGSGIPLKVNNTTALNDYIEYNFTGTSVTFGFYASASSTSNAEVKIDGVVVENINLSTAPAGVGSRKYFTLTGGPHTLRITRSGSGGNMYIAGINFGEVGDDTVSGTVDSLAYGVAGATVEDNDARDYIVSGGATDYAFHDGALLAGSVHGGEYSDYVSWRVDGVAVDPVAAGNGTIIATGKSIVLEQRTNFGWDSERRFDTRSVTDWTSDGGWSFICQMTARPAEGIELYSAYTQLSTTSPVFSEIEFPLHLVPADNSKTSLGRTEYVRQRNPLTGDTVESFFTIMDIEDNKYGGVYCWNSPGAYNKIYYAPVVEGKLTLKNLAFVSKKVFS